MPTSAVSSKASPADVVLSAQEAAIQAGKLTLHGTVTDRVLSECIMIMRCGKYIPVTAMTRKQGVY